MNELKILENPDQIDLNRHGVIEAHAGTGKTYTIEKMVLRLLRTRRQGQWIHVRQILLVTFTDKAAGELKSRIRAGIEKAIESESDELLKLHLSDCLNNLHEAFIGTIHGVCLRLLQTWPFETGVPFGTQMVVDSEGLEKTLRDLIRQDWQEEDSLIPWALERLRGQGKAMTQASLQEMVQLALASLDKEHTVVERGECHHLDLPTLRTQIETTDRQLKEENVQTFFDQLTEYGTLLEQFAQDLEWESKRSALLEKVAEIQKNVQKQQVSSEWVNKLGHLGRSKVFTNSSLKNPNVRTAQTLLEFLQNHSYVALCQQKEKQDSQLPAVLLFTVAESLRDKWIAQKEREGLLSFQDMLRYMEQAVASADFCDNLRERLCYGIIDEFQDTSVQQWNIFRTLFMDKPGPILYIVGDPKQSIYAFQGADVHTYMDAKKYIVDQGGGLYGLVRNYRSSPDLIQGYNTILGQSAALAADWFAMPGVAYPMTGEGGQMAMAPLRASTPQKPCPYAAVQVMLLDGSAEKRRQQMAKQVCTVIRSLVGTTVSIPAGDQWVEKVLSFSDFAVVVEGHKAAEPFLKEFVQQGIPATKYKMEGVFQSPMAQDLITLLQAIVSEESDVVSRTTALLTRFYNKHPTAIVPESDLEADSPLAQDLACWADLADRRRFGQLFFSIRERTGLVGRLARWVEGERFWADLMQIEEYCLECLVRRNLSLHGLIEHLRMLKDQVESVSGDRNLHVLSTGLACVKVLTMHASKGLEFPVVFAVAGGSSTRQRTFYSWIDESHRQVVAYKNTGHGLGDSHNLDIFCPTWMLIGKTEAKNTKASTRLVCEQKLRVSEPHLLQTLQERRRLLYVALTRPQLLLFVGAQVETVVQGPNGVDWVQCEPSTQSQDQDLTPRLLELLRQGQLHLFNPTEWPKPQMPLPTISPTVIPEMDAALNLAHQESQRLYNRVLALQLPNRYSHQTSYTELSHGYEQDRRLNPSEELELDSVISEEMLTSALPGGKETGDALHLVLEECLQQPHLPWVVPGGEPPMTLRQSLVHYLEQNRVFRRLPSEDQQTPAVDAGLLMVQRALDASMDLSPLGMGMLRLADLPLADRRTELEFQLQVGKDWVRGFMDLVFRLPVPGAVHPWRYFVLDWKSNTLNQYSLPSITRSMVDAHYDLQARLYGHALHKTLQGLLGPLYDPTIHLGGAVYVYLRGYEFKTEVPVWTCLYDVESDQKFVDQLMQKRFAVHSEVSFVSLGF